MILTHQLVSIAIMLFSGMLIGATLDAYRLFWYKRKTFKLYPYHRLFEILLWILWAIITFWLLYKVKGGNWRYLDPIAQIAGIFFYDKKAKHVFRFIGRIIDRLILRPIQWIIMLFVMMISKIIKFILGILKFIYKFFYRLLIDR